MLDMLDIYRRITEYGIGIDVEKLQRIIDDNLFAQDTQKNSLTKAKEILRHVNSPQFGADGRVHPTYNEGRTGRYSTSQPQIQNLPNSGTIAKSLKECFVPPDGSIFVYGDIKQAELRILAHLSQDKTLIELLNGGTDDLHKYIASLFYEVDVAGIIHEQRQKSKEAAFALIYGGTLGTFANLLGLPLSNAQKAGEKFFEVFSGVKEYIERIKAQPGKTVQTIGGRILYPNDNRQKINYVIQGSIADISNAALKKLDSTGYKVVLQCHDSILIECPLSRIETAKKDIESAFKKAFYLSVEIEVDITTGKNLDEVNPTSEVEKPNAPLGMQKKSFTSLSMQKKLFCTDDPTRGVYKAHEYIANTKKYVQMNSEFKLSCLALDIDFPVNEFYAQEMGLLIPTYHISNPENNHAHIVYQLKTPVLLGDNSRKHPQMYFEAIRLAYILKLKADTSYSGLLCKNPANEAWVVVCNPEAIYSLGELAKPLGQLPKGTGKKKIVVTGDDGIVYRHQSLFEQCKGWSYRELRHYVNGSFQDWEKAVFEHLMSKNYFDEHCKGEKLPVGEIASLAKSMANFAWENLDPIEFSEIQRQRAKIGCQKRAPILEDRNLKIKEMLTMGSSVAEVASEAELDRRTIYRVGDFSLDKEARNMKILELFDKGLSIPEIAISTGISPRTIYRIVNNL